jgi:hypothetical protein
VSRNKYLHSSVKFANCVLSLQHQRGQSKSIINYRSGSLRLLHLSAFASAHSHDPICHRGITHQIGEIVAPRGEPPLVHAFGVVARCAGRREVVRIVAAAQAQGHDVVDDRSTDHEAIGATIAAQGMTRQDAFAKPPVSRCAVAQGMGATTALGGCLRATGEGGGLVRHLIFRAA